VLSPPTDANDLVWGTGKWGQKNWAGPTTGGTFKAAVRGANADFYPAARRFSFIVSWLNGYEPVKIHPIVVFYKRVNFRTEETE
jgi:hypothetical protein